MVLFTLFAQIQVGSKLAARFFNRHAEFCASHQILVIVLAISIVLPLCYPAIDTYYLNPVRDVRNTFFWEVSSSRSQISKETFIEKCGTQPSFRVEQIFIKLDNSRKHSKGGNVNVLEKNILLWTLNLQERVMDTVVMYQNQLPSFVTKKYSLSDLCFKPSDSDKCLIHSPLDYWSNNADNIFSDPSIPKTLSLASKTPSLGMSTPLNSVFGNLVYEKKKIVSADSIILTYFLKGNYESQTTSIWNEIWQQAINNTYTTYDRIIDINMNNQGEIKHLFFNVDRNGSSEFSAEQALLMLAYLIFSIYILSMGRLNSIKSKFGLVFSAVAHVFASLTISLSIFSLFDITLTFDSVSWKLLPFVFILVSIENMFIIINAVPAITTQLNVKKRIAEGLEKVGYTMTKILISWFLVLMIFSVTNINSIQEFCIFTSIAMIIDFMLQMSFFIAVLSIDLERLALEISNLYNNRISNPDDNINKKSIQHSKTTNYGRRIGILLVVLILLIAVTNIHHANMNLPYIKSSLNSLISDFIVPPTNTYTNTTFWETSIDKTANEFWGVINPDKKNQFVEIRPTRYLTLSYDIESDDLSRSLNDVKNWKLIIRIYIKTFVWFLKVIIFPIISIIFAMSILANFSSADIEIRITRLFENSNNDENKNTLSTRSSAFCVNSAQVITLRGRHSADIDLLCANFNGIIISSATDRHITSWNGKQGIPLRKLERYMRRCDTCKCDSTGGLKNCISWPVRAMCMNEKVELAAAGFEDGVIRVWDINSGQLSYILKDTVEDVEQIMSAINNENSIKERVTCLQIITPNLHSYYNTSELLSEQKTPAILFATYRNGYFREWDLTSGQITHTICTNQKGGISCLFVVDDPDEIRIFTGARDGSVKCWVRTIYDLDNEFNIIDLDCDESRKNAWKLLYTLSGELGNAITSVDAKVVKTKNGCFGITVIGAADGEVRLYDYLTGQIITTLSYGTFNKQKIAKENKKQIFQQQQKRKIKDYSLEQDSSDEDYEFWDETEDFVSHQDAITSIIIHPLMEEVCPCGDTKETSGFSIITSSLDEKVNFWQLTRSFINCKCMASQLDDYDGEDASERPQKVSQWDNATIKYLGHVEQPGGSETVLLKGNIIGVRRVKNSKVHTKRSHGAEGEWEVWTLDISDLHMLELTEKIENSENHDDFVDFEVKTIPLVSEIDIIMEEQRKSKDKRQGRENVGRLKGFVGRRNAVSIANKNYNQNHLHDHNEEDYAQGQVVDFRNPSQKRRVYPDNSQNDRKLTSFKEDDEMNEMLPFSYIRRVVKVGEDGIAVTYGNFVKVISFNDN